MSQVFGYLFFFFYLFFSGLTSVAVRKQRNKQKTKTILVGEEFICLIRPHHNPSRDAKLGTEAKQEPGSINGSRDQRTAACRLH